MNDMSFEDFEKREAVAEKVEAPKMEQPFAEVEKTIAEVNPTQPSPEAKQEVKPAPAAPQTRIIKYDGEQGVELESLGQAMHLALVYCKSGLVPKSFDTPEKVFVAMQLCSERGWKFMNMIGNLMVMNGRISLWGNLPLSLAYQSGQLEEFEEFFVSKNLERTEMDTEIFGAVCIAKRFGQTPVKRTFTLDDAKKAELMGKDTWRKYTKRMLQMRARGWALNDCCPDALNGLAIAEYHHDNFDMDTATSRGTPKRVESKKSGLNALIEEET